MLTTFKKHSDELVKKIRLKVGFFFRNRSCLSLNSRKQVVQSTLLPVLDYGDTIYQIAAATTLKPLDAVYHSAVRFITGDSCNTPHCILYQKVGWSSLKSHRSLHYSLFVYKALLIKLGESAFSFNAHDFWNNLQNSQCPDSLVPLGQFRSLMLNLLNRNCICLD